MRCVLAGCALGALLITGHAAAQPKQGCPPGTTWNGQRCDTSSPAPGGIGAIGSVPPCESGKVADVDGHCCWPGQAWGAQSGRCRGKPACPAGLTPAGEDCLAICRPPMVKSVGHCCLPGQEWSDAAQRCVGEAVCPSGWTAQGDGCVKSCEAGHVAVDGLHCCFPGQTFVGSEESGTCRGVPTCAPGWQLEGTTCLSPAEAEKHAKEREAATEVEKKREKVALVGEGSGSLLGFAYTTASTNAGPRLALYDWYGQLHWPGLPISFQGAIGAGSYADDSGSSFSVGHTMLGASLAPFSFPNASTHAFSLFNPSIGLAWHRVSLSTTAFGQKLAPEGSSSGMLEIADALLLQGRAGDVPYGYGLLLRFGYLRNLTTDSQWAPSSAFFIALSVTPFFD